VQRLQHGSSPLKVMALAGGVTPLLAQQSCSVWIAYGKPASVKLGVVPAKLERRLKFIGVNAGLSADLLAGVSTIALKSRLAEYKSVETKIDCTLASLLQGRVAGVQVRGSGCSC